MSGSRFGRGRNGRLIFYGICVIAILVAMLVCHFITSEMARLREMHVQCLHQQESLAAQLQVIFEYKVRLEKSLAEEKSSNAAVKQELQQRASREKSMRDKDSMEALARFNSLQQAYNILQSEHQDLQEECKKRETQAQNEYNKLQVTLHGLRVRIQHAEEDKTHALEELKTKYLETDNEKTKLQEKYNELLQNRENTGSTVDHLRKEIFQLRRELESAKKLAHISTPSSSVLMTPRASVSQSALQKEDSQPIPAPQQQQQQQSVTSSRRVENTTVANANLVSPSPVDKPALPPVRPKVKLPAGVLPIPKIIVPKLVDDVDEEKRQEETRKREEAAAFHSNLQPPPAKLAPANADDKMEKESVVEAGNLDPPFVANFRNDGEQPERRNDAWLRVGPGVQEVGEEPNQLGRVPGLDDGQANGGDDQYDGGDYDKEPQQKNGIHLAEGEDEGEDEGDMLEYPHNLKQEKRE
ncbi:Golgi integral membrane protein 4 [Pogonomyrmex barbatus]|uniref:Golgi integral membrane protein 4 n=1 Tax=Pogonomyrmex barbatus TaxID=144034 RepID=A0A6I9VXM4_9HYME|nr:Golgi integral membrane protein 4 [Pogonomyrmex barbatus]